ncbi:DNA methyltransferase [Bacillus sp. NPDC093026]|uniref:DNA methyltransferase n=1 Tax=Bacillus sp. NPDC093026 TaxID=3363948 RepID=UPI003809DC2B
MTYSVQNKQGLELNRFYEEDLPIHDWYRFILSYPPHLVRNYVNEFNLNENHTVLDPFCGTGTTVVECKKMGVKSVGLEANPLAQLAGKVKIDWNIDGNELVEVAKEIAQKALEKINEETSLRTLSEEKQKLIIKNSISELPLHKTLILCEVLEDYDKCRYYDHLKLALAKQIVFSYSNLKFGPEVGVSRKKKQDADVVGLWIKQVENMSTDLQQYQTFSAVESEVILGDARDIKDNIPKASIDAVITSPPYPNEKDYTRTTRLESVILGYVNTKAELRANKEKLLRSNTRNVYVKDDDEKWVKDNKTIQSLVRKIEDKRIELNKTSGFEKYYHRVVELYFGGIARHLESLKSLLKPNAKLAYVVGDQASYFRVLIKTGEIIAEVATDLGYKVERIDLFRTRISTVTGEQLKEEVVILSWEG